MSYLTIDDLKPEAVVELFNSAKCLEEFCAHMCCDTCVLYPACTRIDNYPKQANSMYHLMYAVKNFIWKYINDNSAKFRQM